MRLTVLLDPNSTPPSSVVPLLPSADTEFPKGQQIPLSNSISLLTFSPRLWDAYGLLRRVHGPSAGTAPVARLPPGPTP